MSASRLAWYTTGDVAIAALQNHGTAVPLEPSATKTYRIYNNFGDVGANTAVGYYLTAKGRNVGETAFVGAGREVVDAHWAEVRIKQGLGGLTHATGPWTPLGAGRALELPALANAEGVEIEERELVKSTVDADVEVSFAFEKRNAVPIPDGLVEIAGQGIFSGVGDGEATWLLTASNVVENPGGVDADVLVNDTKWVAAGRLFFKVRHLLTIPNTDGASSALSSGQRYKALIYAAADGTIALAKGIKTTGTAAAPALPAGGKAIAEALREFDGLVNNGDITQRWLLGNAGFSSTGLTGTISPFRGLVDNALVASHGAANVPLEDDETNRIWVLSDGDLAATITADPPTGQVRAELIYEVATASGNVTAVVDRRNQHAAGFRVQRLDFIFDASLAGAQKQRASYCADRDGWLVGIETHLLGSGTGSGQTIFDINKRAPGGAFATLFPSQGTPASDRRPTIASAAATLYAASDRAEVTKIEAHSLLEWEVDDVPGSTVPAWAQGTLFIAVAA